MKGNVLAKFLNNNVINIFLMISIVLACVKGQKSEKFLKENIICNDGYCWFADTEDKVDLTLDVKEEEIEEKYAGIADNIDLSIDDVRDFEVVWIHHTIKDFWITQTEITARQYHKCVKDGGCNNPNHYYNASERPRCTYDGENSEDYPMNCVDYDGANKMCKWLGGRVCKEIEWNDACKGINPKGNRYYPYGSKFIEEACLVGVSGDGKTLEKVLSRKKCKGGLDELYDMGGSLSEWIDADIPKNAGRPDYRKFKPISYSFNGPVDKKVCENMCAGNDKGLKTAALGIRCCRSL